MGSPADFLGHNLAMRLVSITVCVTFLSTLPTLMVDHVQGTLGWNKHCVLGNLGCNSIVFQEIWMLKASHHCNSGME